MSKKGRKKRKAIRISPESTLRPRLDNLWAEGALLHKGDGAIEGDLDVVARDIAPDFLMETMLRAYTDASAPVRARLDDVLPGWLSRHDHVSVLKEMVVEHALAQDLRSAAVAWMEAAGVQLSPRDLELQPEVSPSHPAAHPPTPRFSYGSPPFLCRRISLACSTSHWSAGCLGGSRVSAPRQPWLSECQALKTL